MITVNKLIKELVPADYNPRELKKDQFQQIKESIEKFGVVDPIIINSNPDRKNIIIGGHQRVKVAESLGFDKLPCVEIDLTLEEEKELNVRLNKNTGQWDWDLLANHFEQNELLEWGFNEIEVGSISIDPEEGLTDDDAVPDIDDTETICKKGDFWKLGKHYLLCGDSTVKKDIDKLIGEDKINLIFTDPPYGVSYTGTSGESNKTWSKIHGDDLRDDNLYKFLFDAFNNLNEYTDPGTPAYIFHASSTQIEFQKALEDSGYRIKQQLIWQKGMVLSRSDYHWTHEPMFYAVKGEQNCKWYGDRTHRTLIDAEQTDYNKLTKKELVDILTQAQELSTVWQIKKDSALLYKHPTQKPVELAIRAIKNNTIAGESVIDIFAGSGSTLIACEKTNRKSYALEYDPKYCDVIIKRFEEFTGDTAKLVE